MPEVIPKSAEGFRMVGADIRFNDGAAYESFMGIWSGLAGRVFLDWLAVRPKARWIDVGCGNGAFTELIVTMSAPSEVQGIDPSEGQIAFAKARAAVSTAQFRIGDAMMLPFPDRSFDAAVMALVLFFVPKPSEGVAEMARVTAPGGTVAAYAWDVHGGGFPAEPVWASLRDLGFPPPLPPSVDASRIEAMQSLWAGANLERIETRTITVHRTFEDFDDFWTSVLMGPGIRALVNQLPPDQITILKADVSARLSPDSSGRITCSARANAIKGHVPR